MTKNHEVSNNISSGNVCLGGHKYFVLCEVSFNSYNSKELALLEQIGAIIMAANKGC